MPMGKTISFVKGKGSIGHNNRTFLAKNVNPERVHLNTYYKQQKLEETYDQLFGAAIAEYNAKQKRKDRQIKDYLTDIRNSGNKEKQFYEIVVQVGKRTDTGVVDENGNISEDAKIAEQILDQYVKSFQERNPNLYLFNAVLHMDEATPHLHLDYIPVAHGYKSKMHTRNSLTKGLQEMGIEPATSKEDTETMHWQQREREYITKLCRDRDIEIEIIGVDRDNYTIPEYKAAMKATEELSAEIEILQAEKMEAESMIASVDLQVEDAQEKIAESEQQLTEIKDQIAEKEKRYKVYEQKIDKVLVAGKPVKKELSGIRKNVKQVPSILGGDSLIKIPERDFERLMSIAEVAGTVENLNESYEKGIGKMKTKISNLSNQVKEMTEKVENYESFMKLKGLVEEFEKFIRPQTLKERLEINKETVKDHKKNKDVVKLTLKNKHDIAI